MITIKITAKLPFDNEIQFFDVCKGIADKLTEIGEDAISQGDVERFIGQKFDVTTANDDAEECGFIQVSD